MNVGETEEGCAQNCKRKRNRKRCVQHIYDEDELDETSTCRRCLLQNDSRRCSPSLYVCSKGPNDLGPLKRASIKEAFLL